MWMALEGRPWAWSVMMFERTRNGVEQWMSEHGSPSIIGLCLDAGIDPGQVSDLVLEDDYDWLKYGVWRIMAAAEARLFSSVTGLRDMLIRCERIVGAASSAETAPGDSLESWISAG
jgi:hypothetical protein